MGAHHYLPFRGLVGRSQRYVAVLGEHWPALVGWHAGRFGERGRIDVGRAGRVPVVSRSCPGRVPIDNTASPW